MKIRVLPSQPHCFAFGGFDIQMLDAMRAARDAGVDIEPLDIWSRDATFDVLHLWGVEETYLNALKWARLSGKRVVLTGLLPYVTPYTLLRNLVSRYVGPNRRLRAAFQHLDAMVVVNESQVMSARLFLGISRERIKVIPNIVNKTYFASSVIDNISIPFSGPYLLCAGNICRRKNQLEVARAANDASVSLLLVGSVLNGEEGYANEIEAVVRDSTYVHWLKELPPGDPRLVALYKNCSGYILASYSETQPISVLEAIACGVPLVLANRAWARQSEFCGALLVDPSSRSSIAEAMQAVLRQPDAYRGNVDVATQFSAKDVGGHYAHLYHSLVAGVGASIQHKSSEVCNVPRIKRRAFALDFLRVYVKHVLSNSPAMTYALIEKGDGGVFKRNLFVTPETRIVIEGFPRSGNTFATCAFQYAQGGPNVVPVAHHLHSLANVIQGIRNGIPVLVVVRTPKDAIISYKISHPSQSYKAMLYEYILFHRGISKVRDNVLIASFDQVISDFGTVTSRLNKHFDTNFFCFDGAAESVDAVFRMVDEANFKAGGDKFMQVARPTKERQLVRPVFEMELHGDHSLTGLLSKADEVYRSLLVSRA
jgi:glycosyltransferase involved in cell wall biosynthesis